MSGKERPALELSAVSRTDKKKRLRLFSFWLNSYGSYNGMAQKPYQAYPGVVGVILVDSAGKESRLNLRDYWLNLQPPYDPDRRAGNPADDQRKGGDDDDSIPFD